MEELIKIQEHNGKKAVSARELYEKLGFDKSQWARWYKKNITENQFAFETEDWIGFDIKSNGNITKDFVLSIDFAKKISMLARTEVGEKIRNYFIKVEAELNALKKPLSSLELLKLSIKSIEEQQLQIDEIKNEVKELKAAKLSAPDYFTIMGFATIKGIKIGLNIAATYGKKARSICIKNNFPMDEIPDPRFGRVRAYPREVLEKVFNQSV